MRVALDVRMLHNSGIGTTIRGLLDNFTEEQRRQLVLLDSERVPYKIYGLRQHWSYGRWLNRQGFDLFHMPHYDVPLSYAGPLVVTIHDVIHYLFPGYSTKPFSKVYSWFFLRHAARRASRLIANSECTRNDFLKLFPEAAPKMRVLYPGIDEKFKPVEGGLLKNVLDVYRLKSGYCLYVGNLRESKNTRGLISGYLKARENQRNLPPLVLAGKNSLAGIDFSALAPAILYLGPVPGEHLAALYSGASLFIFPSFYEGFGLPALEAMACGVPVIASNAGSLPETCGDAAEYVDPRSVDGIAGAIAHLQQSKARRDDLRAKGFARVKRYSWKSFAEGTWRVYEEVAGENRR